MQHCFLLSRKSLRFLGSAMGIAIAHRKICCDFGALSCCFLGHPHLVAHDCGYPLSRYTCRATRVAADFLDFIAFCRCSTGVALHPPRNFGVAPFPPPVRREVSHRNLGLKRCRATRGCRSYSCRCRATLCN